MGALSPTPNPVQALIGRTGNSFRKAVDISLTK